VDANRTFSHSAPVRQPGQTEATPRERDMLALVALGYSNREMGDQLGVAESTAKTHLHRLASRLCARSRAHLVTVAQLHGWLVIRPSDEVPARPVTVVISMNGASTEWDDSV
jgi:DNA-binding NarL/FixJ family response regulator